MESTNLNFKDKNNESQEKHELLLMPHNIQAEQSLLGAIMLNNEVYEKVSEFLLSVHFYMPIHGKIYNAITYLCDKNLSADPITLKDYFSSESELEGVGGAKYFVELVNSVISIGNSYNYAKIIYDNFIRRQLVNIGQDMIFEAKTFTVEKEAISQIENAEFKLFELANNGQIERGFIQFHEAAAQSVRSIEKSLNNGSKLPGITTGFCDLDSELGGLQRSDLIILAGRPSMGKTALATNIAYNAAKSNYKNKDDIGVVAFFSLEMSCEQLASRILSQESGIPSEKIRNGSIQKSDFDKIVSASKDIGKIPLLIDDTPGLTVAKLRTRARRIKRKQGLCMIVIDYLQLLFGSVDKRHENRVQEISEITRGLKAVAKELDVPVLALSQLSRAVEAREDKRPQLSDLRESGSIEQDADVVMFVYRDEYYKIRSEPQIGTDKHVLWQQNLAKVYNIAEIIIAKQRHGPVGTARLFFNSKFTKFDNLSESRKNEYSK